MLNASSSDRCKHNSIKSLFVCSFHVVHFNNKFEHIAGAYRLASIFYLASLKANIQSKIRSHTEKHLWYIYIYDSKCSPWIASTQEQH